MIVGGYERDPAPWCVDGRHPADVQQPAARPRLGPLRARSPRPAQHVVPALVDADVRPARQRPGGVHARRRVHPRRERGRRVLRRRRVLRPRHRRRRRHRQGDRRVDRRSASRRWTCGRWTSAASGRSTRSPRLLPGPDRTRCTRTYYDIAYPNHERPAGRPLRTPAGLRPPRARSARCSARRAGGSGSTGTRSNEDPAHERLRPRGLGGRALVDGDRHRAPRHPRTPPGCSTSRASPRSRSSGPGAVDLLERLCANRVDRARRLDHVHVDAQLHAAASSATSPSPGSASSGSSSSPARRSAATTGAWIDAARSERRLGRGPRRHRRARRASGCGGRRPRDDPRRRVRRRPDVPVHAGPARSPSATCRAGRCRVTYVGELGWELYPTAEYGLRAVGHARSTAGRRTAWCPAATGRSTRCAWRRATGCGAPTSRRRPTRTRRGSGSPCAPTRTSSAGTPLPGRRRRSARGWSCLVLDDVRAVALGNEPVRARPVRWSAG